MEYKQQWDIERDPTPVHCFITILFKLMISKVGHFSCHIMYWVILVEKANLKETKKNHWVQHKKF